MIDKYARALDRIDHLGKRDWRDRHAEGTVRNILMGLYADGLLERAALLEEMRARGYNDAALRRLDRFVDKTYLLVKTIEAERARASRGSAPL